MAKKLFEWWESLERILLRVLEVLKKQRPAVLIKDNKIKSPEQKKGRPSLKDQDEHCWTNCDKVDLHHHFSTCCNLYLHYGLGEEMADHYDGVDDDDDDDHHAHVERGDGLALSRVV